MFQQWIDYVLIIVQISLTYSTVKVIDKDQTNERNIILLKWIIYISTSYLYNIILDSDALILVNFVLQVTILFHFKAKDHLEQLLETYDQLPISTYYLKFKAILRLYSVVFFINSVSAILQKVMPSEEELEQTNFQPIQSSLVNLSRCIEKTNQSFVQNITQEMILPDDLQQLQSSQIHYQEFLPQPISTSSLCYTEPQQTPQSTQQTSERRKSMMSILDMLDSSRIEEQNPYQEIKQYQSQPQPKKHTPLKKQSSSKPPPPLGSNDDSIDELFKKLKQNQLKLKKMQSQQA